MRATNLWAWIFQAANAAINWAITASAKFLRDMVIGDKVNLALAYMIEAAVA